jgi:hypothetical protein
MTRIPIGMGDIQPNRELKLAIDAFRAEYPFADDLEIDREDLLSSDL